ncbi:MAG: hypothetical protein NVSMB19_23140 [Vulcanimicrobiaceae bacterium]
MADVVRNAFVEKIERLLREDGFGAHAAIEILGAIGAKRLREDDGSWVTINGTAVHINGAGAADKGPSALVHPKTGAKSSASPYDKAAAELHAHVTKIGATDYKSHGSGEKAARAADQKELGRLGRNLSRAIQHGE